MSILGAGSRTKPAASYRRALDPRHVWKWTTLTPMLGVGAVFLFTVFDPFEFESITKHHSAKVFYQIYAASYPAKLRDDIAIVFLDDHTIKKFNDSWPPSHLVHSEILRSILQYEPAAVFVDMFFFHTSPDDHFQNTVAVIEEYRRNQIPIFVAAAGIGTGARSIGRPEIDKLVFAKKISLVSAELTGEAGEPPLYPLHRDASNYEPAALALYRAVCGDQELRNEGFAPDTEALRQIRTQAKCAAISAIESKKNMDVVWGLAPAAINCKRANITSEFLGLKCEDLYRSIVGRTIQLLWEAPIPPLHRPTNPLAIPYHAEISTTDLLQGEKYQELMPVLSGKVVIYSSQVSPRKDFVLSPVHGNIDGAFIHAMALDNLLSFGDGYIREAPEGLFHKDWTEFQPGALMLVVSFLMIWHRVRLVTANAMTSSVEAVRKADERFLILARRFVIATVVLMGLLEFLVWRIAPFNWVGLIIVVHIAHRIDKWFFRDVEREAEAAGWNRHQNFV